MEKGYRAFVDVYDEEYYVDTNTGEGFDKVLAKIDPLLNKFASTMYIPGYKFEDAKSELSIIAIEGIMSFDPHRDIKLSTFLHKHIHNKRISLIKSENKMSNDAFSLHTSDDEPADKRKIKKAREELYFSQFKPLNDNDSQPMPFENSISEEGLTGNDSTIIKNKFDKSEFESSLDKICEKLDTKTKKIIELMYYEDYSIKDAADEVGLSGWAASMRLKKLASRGHIQDIFGFSSEDYKEFLNRESEGMEYFDAERGIR
jgi:RNA polymerase sigma factor (sigma-70 family)